MLSFALLAVATGVHADDGVWVEQNDGSKQGFLFADKPKITYEADSLVFTTADATTKFPVADLKRLYFDNDIVLSIGTVKAGSADKIVRATREGAELSGYAAGAAVAVYDLNGRLFQQLKVRQDGTLAVNLSALPQGVYVIKTEKTTIKIQKR